MEKNPRNSWYSMTDGMYFTKEHITRVRRRLFLSLCLVFLMKGSILLFCRPGVLGGCVPAGQLFQGGITLLFRLLFFSSGRLIDRTVRLEGAILLHLALVVLIKWLLHVVAHIAKLSELLLLLLLCYRLVVIVLLLCLLLLLLLLLHVEWVHVVELCLLLLHEWMLLVHVCSLVWRRIVHLLLHKTWLIVVSTSEHLLMLVVHHGCLRRFLCLWHRRNNGDGRGYGVPWEV